MGFLKKYLKNTYRDNQPVSGPSSFENLSAHQLQAHLERARYGSFTLTDAIRPAYEPRIIPSAGFREDKFRDHESGVEIPVLMAAASREHLFDLFLDLLDPLGDTVDVVLETSHDRQGEGHLDLHREHIDLPVLKSILLDYEDLLLNDGCTGVAVLNPRIPLEVQFDEHKLLIMYGQKLDWFRYIMGDYPVGESPELRFITEAEHIHSSSEEFLDRFDQLRYRLGIED